MKATKRELQYAKEHFGEVHHTTLNPEGPGVVRIHLLPPQVTGQEISGSLAIINGQDIIPVNVSWSILLTELIEKINPYSGRELTKEDTEKIVSDTCSSVKKIYPFISRRSINSKVA